MFQYPQYYEVLYEARLAYNYLYIAINKQTIQTLTLMNPPQSYE